MMKEQTAFANKVETSEFWR